MNDEQRPARTRDRMIDAAVAGLQRNGAANTSFTEVLDASGAARGAIYHHFPGGKTQLLAEAGERSGEAVRGALSSLPSESPLDVISAFLGALEPVMAAAAEGGGCAVAAVALAGEDELNDVASSTFASWEETLASRLRASGLGRRESGERAALLIALMEGAQVLCRAAGTTEPYRRAARAALRDAGAGKSKD